MLEEAAVLGKGIIHFIPEPLRRMNPLLRSIACANDAKSKNAATWALQLLMLEHYCDVRNFVTAFRENGCGRVKTILVERNAETSLIFAELPGSSLDESQRADLRKMTEDSRIRWDLRILVKTPVKVCLERIAKRLEQRGHEKWLLTTPAGMQYLRELERAMSTKHEMMPQKESRGTIDGLSTKNDMLHQLMSVLRKHRVMRR